MRVERADKLTKKLRKLPREVRADVVKAIERNTKQGVRVARVLAPEDSGKTKREIVARYLAGGMVGIVEAIDPNAPRPDKDRAYSIEYGRKRGKRGKTEGAQHMRTTRSYMAERAKKSIARAVRKAAKRVGGNV